jgi:hypothetical protein
MRRSTKSGVGIVTIGSDIINKLPRNRIKRITALRYHAIASCQPVSRQENTPEKT